MTQQQKACFALIVTVLLWGTSFVAIRESMHHFSPIGLALLRYIISAIAVIPIYACLSVRKRPNLKELSLLFLLGLIGMGFYNIILNLGETTTSAAVTSFIVSQSPVATIILAVIFLRERLTRLSWFGIVLSICGIMLISRGEQELLGHFNYGMIYLIIAVICTAIYSIAQKPLLKQFHPLEVTAWSIWFGTLTLTFFTPSLLHEVQHQAALNYFWPVFLGIGSGVIGYACLAYGFKHYPASKAASFLFAMPFVSTIIGWIALGEVPTLLCLFGGLLTMSGAFMIRVIPSEIIVK